MIKIKNHLNKVKQFLQNISFDDKAQEIVSLVLSVASFVILLIFPIVKIEPIGLINLYSNIFNGATMQSPLNYLLYAILGLQLLTFIFATVVFFIKKRKIFYYIQALSCVLIFLIDIAIIIVKPSPLQFGYYLHFALRLIVTLLVVDYISKLRFSQNKKKEWYDAYINNSNIPLTKERNETILDTKPLNYKVDNKKPNYVADIVVKHTLEKVKNNHTLNYPIECPLTSNIKITTIQPNDNIKEQIENATKVTASADVDSELNSLVDYNKAYEKYDTKKQTQDPKLQMVLYTDGMTEQEYIKPVFDNGDFEFESEVIV